jgi:hypothetical protein
VTLATEPGGSPTEPCGSAAGPSPLGYWLLVGLLAAFAAAKAVRFDTLDPDCFWHLRVADQLVHDGVGPLVDHLSFSSRPEPWTPYSWGAELAMLAVWNTGGFRAAVAAQAILEAAFVMLLGAACAERVRIGSAVGIPPLAPGSAGVPRGHRHGGWQLARPPQSSPPTPAEPGANGMKKGAIAQSSSPTLNGPGTAPTRHGVADATPPLTSAALATAVGVYLSLPYLSFRPVTLALVLMAAALWLTLRDRRVPSRAVWLVVPITAVLANVHLYALLMPVAAALFLLGDAIDRRPMRRTAWLAAAVAAASVATPMLPGMIRTALFYGTRDAMVSGPVIAEMRPWGRDVGSVILLAAILAAVARSRASTGVLLWTAAATVGVLTLGRFAPVLALAACPPLAAGLPRLSDRALTRRSVIVALSVVLLGCVGRTIASFPAKDVPLSAWLDRLGPDVPGYPCAAADFVADHTAPVTGRIINEFTWGGYLAWRLGDRWQVLLDGRTQVVPASLWRSTYLGSDADCRSFLATVYADAAVLPAGRSRFRAALLDLGWTVAHHDEWADVLVPAGANGQREGANVQRPTLNVQISTVQKRASAPVSSLDVER